MTSYEVAAENGMRVRVDAEGETDEERELDAVMQAGELDENIWYAGAYPANGKPIGWDGGDADDAIAVGQSQDNGDYV